MTNAEELDHQAESHTLLPDDDPQLFNLRTLGFFTVFLVGLIGFVLVSAALLSGFFLPGGSLVVTPAPTLLPPEPRLEANPAQSFQALRATQQAELDSYGWIDRENGVVHVPIERAMELVAESDLPVVQATPTAAASEAP